MDDLSFYSYCVDEPLHSVASVGWLDTTEDFTKGEVADKYLNKLEAYINKGAVPDNSIVSYNGDYEKKSIGS